MKKFLFLTVLVLTQLAAYAQADDSISVPISETDPPEYAIPPRKGNRMPSKQQTCVIDFSSMTISSSISAEIITFELWNDTGEYMVASTVNDNDMVIIISSLKGCYQLNLITETSCYTGFIEL